MQQLQIINTKTNRNNIWTQSRNKHKNHSNLQIFPSDQDKDSKSEKNMIFNHHYTGFFLIIICLFENNEEMEETYCEYQQKQRGRRGRGRARARARESIEQSPLSNLSAEEKRDESWQDREPENRRYSVKSLLHSALHQNGLRSGIQLRKMPPTWFITIHRFKILILIIGKIFYFILFMNLW